MNQLESHCLVHLAIEEDSILSFYDLNMDYTDQGTCISCSLFAKPIIGAFLLIRNATKKTMWNAELFYKLAYTDKDSENKNNLPEKELYVGADDPETKVSQASLVRESLDMLNVERGKTSEAGKNFQELLEDQFRMEEEYDQKPLDYWRSREEKKYLSSIEVKDEEEEVKFDRHDGQIMDKIKGLKLLLLNTGVLSAANLDKVC